MLLSYHHPFLLPFTFMFVYTFNPFLSSCYYYSVHGWILVILMRNLLKKSQYLLHLKITDDWQKMIRCVCVACMSTLELYVHANFSFLTPESVSWIWIFRRLECNINIYINTMSLWHHHYHLHNEYSTEKRRLVINNTYRQYFITQTDIKIHHLLFILFFFFWVPRDTCM